MWLTGRCNKADVWIVRRGIFLRNLNCEKAIALSLLRLTMYRTIVRLSMNLQRVFFLLIVVLFMGMSLGASEHYDEVKMLAAETSVSSNESPDGRFLYIGYDKISIFTGEISILSREYTFGEHKIDQKTENFVLVYSVDNDTVIVFDEEASTFLTTVEWDLPNNLLVIDSGTSHLARGLRIYNLSTGLCTSLSYMLATNSRHEFGYVYSNELDLFAFRYPIMVNGNNSSFDPGIHTPDMYGIGVVVFNSTGSEVARFESNPPEKYEIVSFTDTLTYKNLSNNEIVESVF